MARRHEPATPWDIQVDITDARDDHRDIVMQPRLQMEDAAAYTFAEVLAGYRWIAGIIARVATSVTEEVQESTRAHRCAYPPGFYVTSCSVTSGWLDPGADLQQSPTVWISVPSSDSNRWLTTVKRCLQQSLDAEAWQPSAEDERAWASASDPANPADPAAPRHNTAPAITRRESETTA